MSFLNRKHIDEYVDNIISSVNASTVYSNSENLIIDSILNYKLQTIANMKIELNVDVAIPKKLDLTDYDMTIILGNLIDNAITALKKCSGKKHFSIKMNYSKGNVMLTLINTYNGEIKEKNGILLTLKDDEKITGWE
jgi:sensor histidine kinase regulating citrate/malate metabolism